jgi:hypothetical protein
MMKMRLTKFIAATFILLSYSAFAQESDAERECKRMLFLAQQARMEKNDYHESAIYMLKAESICEGLDEKNTKILIASLRNTLNGLSDEAQKKAYNDTLSGAFARAEKNGFYTNDNDLIWGATIVGSTNPDRQKANELFKRGIASQGEKIHEGYIVYYYYNLYAMYAAAADKAELKKELISAYFQLSAIIGKANMSQQTQETVTGYFNAVVRTCDDILPDLGGFMSKLPQDPAVKLSQVKNFISLLESKECTDSPEYLQLIDTLVGIDPNSLEAQLMKAKAQMAKKDYRGAINTLKTAKGLSTDDAQKNEITYTISNAQYQSGSYTGAYNTAMSVSGDFRSKALLIAGNAVAKNANSCGNSTFERKCNYIYAAQLLEQAGKSGASMRAQGPTEGEIFDNNSPSSVTLSCYGVSVSL